MNTKQVIVIRKDLKMRRGKEIAQGSHASIAFLTRRFALAQQNNNIIFPNVFLSKAEQDWLDGSFTKVVCQVGSLEELQEVETCARLAKVETHVVVDNGLTEFNGIKTTTCLAIGPDYEDKIDKITGHLRLY